jgi:hypothetical protein
MLFCPPPPKKRAVADDVIRALSELERWPAVLQSFSEFWFFHFNDPINGSHPFQVEREWKIPSRSSVEGGWAARDDACWDCRVSCEVDYRRSYSLSLQRERERERERVRERVRERDSESWHVSACVSIRQHTWIFVANEDLILSHQNNLSYKLYYTPPVA